MQDLQKQWAAYVLVRLRTMGSGAMQMEKLGPVDLVIRGLRRKRPRMLIFSSQSFLRVIAKGELDLFIRVLILDATCRQQLFRLHSRP